MQLGIVWSMLYYCSAGDADRGPTSATPSQETPSNISVYCDDIIDAFLLYTPELGNVQQICRVNVGLTLAHRLRI